MELSRSLLRNFARTINDTSANKKVTSSMTGTVVTSDSKKYVQIDGSNQLTPVSETIDIQDGDRVLVSIENHVATVIGNYTYPPSARTANQAQALAQYSVEQFEALSAIAITTENLKANVAEIGFITADEANIAYAKITDLDVVKADIETLETKSITTDNLEAEVGKLGYLTANQAELIYAKITDLDAIYADIETLETKSITTDNLEAKIAEVGYLSASEIEAKYATITNLDATKAEIETALIGYAKVVDLEAVSTRTTSLEADVADINTLVNGNLTSDNIQSLTLNSTNVTIADGTITNAMIKNLEFSKITGIDINTTNLTIHSEDGKSTWSDNTIQISDATRVRVQIGKDDSGDYTLAIWDATGNLIWDALGATENTIQRKIIRDTVVADDAAIAGSKLDIPSVVEEINGSQTKLKSTTILIDETNQTLDVYLTTIETTIDDNLDAAKLYADGQLSVAQAYALEQANAALVSSKAYTNDEIDGIDAEISDLTEITTSHSTDISVMQGQISSLIAEDTTIKGDYEALVSRYNATVADVDSIKTTIGEHTTLLDTQSGEILDVQTQVNTIEYNLESFEVRLTETYTSLQKYTDEQIDNIEIGGRNLIRNSKTLIFEDYYFDSEEITVTYDEEGNVSIEDSGMDVSYDQNGNVYISGVTYNYDQNGNVNMSA